MPKESVGLEFMVLEVSILARCHDLLMYNVYIDLSSQLLSCPRIVHILREDLLYFNLSIWCNCKLHKGFCLGRIFRWYGNNLQTKRL